MREEAEWRGGSEEGGGQKCVVRSFHYLCIGSACFERFCERYDSIFLHFSVQRCPLRIIQASTDGTE